jgi:cystathionine beta-lyase/cystathionine gamma-synthase
VRFPGLATHPGAALHARQTRGPGQLLSVELHDPSRAAEVVAATQLFTTAVNFGGLSSSISLPSCMSHASVPAARQSSAALPEGLVRISVGIEDAEELWRDLEVALDLVSRWLDAARTETLRRGAVEHVAAAPTR